MSPARHVFRSVITSLAAVMATHALSYQLIALLPDAASRMAGFLGSHEPSVSMLRTRLETRTYWESLEGLLTGDFGKTISGVSVAEELSLQFMDTVPRMAVAAVLVALTASVSISLAPSRRRPTPFLDLMCLIPPYVHAFVALIGLLLLQSVAGPPAAWGRGAAAALSAAIAPAALVAAQASRTTSEVLSADYALFCRSMGLGERSLRRLLRPQVWVALAPSAERTFLWLFLSLIFSEIVLSLPGFGSSFAVALRNSDVNMLLCQIAIIAIVSNSARVVATTVRAYHGIID